MKQPKPYRRLASAVRFGVAVGGRDTLYLGSDHLLLRTVSGFSETYRRFYFADIEAITVCQTIRGIFWNVGFSFGVFFSILPFLTSRGPHYFAGSLTAAFIILLFVNVLRGTTCRAQIQTRVQRSALPLRRQRKALRVVAQLEEKIKEAQARLAASAPVPVETGTTTPVTSATVQSAPPPLPGALPAARVTSLEYLMIAAFVLSGIVALLAAWRVHALLAYATYAFGAANLGLAIAVLVQARRRHLGSRVITPTWTAVVGHAVILPMIYMVYNFIHAFKRVGKLAAAGPIPNRPEQIQAQVGLDALLDLPGFTYVLAGYAAFVLGLAGVSLILAFTVRAPASEAPPL